MRGTGERGGALRAVLIGLGVLAALLIAVIVVGAVYFAQNIRVHETETRRGKTVRVETPVGSVRVREGARLDVSELGVVLYPGAQAMGDGAKVVNLDLGFLGGAEGRFDVLAAEFTTADPPDKVADFYRKECPGWRFHSRGGDRVKLEIDERGFRRVVAIHPQGDGTRITIARVGAPAVN